MKPLILLILIPFLLMSCASLPQIKCAEKRIAALEKFNKRIDVHIAKEGNSEPYFVVSFEAMKEMGEQYNALAEYVNCFEGDL